MEAPVHALPRPTVDASLLPRKTRIPDGAYVGSYAALVLAGFAGGFALTGHVFYGVTFGLIAGSFIRVVDRRVLAVRATKQFNAEFIPAMEMRARGNHEEAEAILVALAHRFAGRPGLASLALFNVA